MVRNLFILVLLASALYAASTVPLGRRTLAEHIRMIGKTPEAKELVEGTKEKLGPAVGKVKDAVLEQVKDSVDRVQDEIRDQAAGQAQKAPANQGYVRGQAPKKAR